MKEVVKVDDGTDPFPCESFTGKWVVLWPNGSKKYSAILKDGKEEGLIQCWWEDGKLAQEGVKQKGVCVGLWKDYNSDGFMYKETEYFEGSQDFTQRVYDADGLAIVREFKDGVKAKETWL